MNLLEEREIIRKTSSCIQQRTEKSHFFCLFSLPFLLRSLLTKALFSLLRRREKNKRKTLLPPCIGRRGYRLWTILLFSITILLLIACGGREKLPFDKAATAEDDGSSYKLGTTSTAWIHSLLGRKPIVGRSP